MLLNFFLATKLSHPGVEFVSSFDLETFIICDHSASIKHHRAWSPKIFGLDICALFHYNDVCVAICCRVSRLHVRGRFRSSKPTDSDYVHRVSYDQQLRIRAGHSLCLLPTILLRGSCLLGQHVFLYGILSAICDLCLNTCQGLVI